MDIEKEQIAAGLEDFVEEFLTDRETQLAQMNAMVQNENFHEIAEVSHQWKSFCAPYGFGELGRIAEELEKVAKDHNADKCDKYIEDAKKYLNWKKEQIASR